eukprot:gene2719-2661_t
MAAHVPTMLAMIIASSLMMAASMAVVGWGRRRDGLGRWAAALLVNAIGHLLIMLRGLIPDLLSIVVGNLMLSSVFVGMIAAVYQFQGRPVRWALLLAPPLLVLVFVSVFIDNFPARVSFVGLVIGLQAVWALLAALSHRHATVGRGQWLLVAGLSLEAVVLGGRALVAISTHSEATNILQGSGLQTLTFLATFSVVLVSSVGFQLARELCKAVEESRCPADGVPGPGIAVTVSIGVFGGRLESGDSWDMLIAAADRALYQAKNNGRNRVEVATGLRRPSAQLAAQANPETLPESLY